MTKFVISVDLLSLPWIWMSHGWSRLGTGGRYSELCRFEKYIFAKKYDKPPSRIRPLGRVSYKAIYHFARPHHSAQQMSTSNCLRPWRSLSYRQLSLICVLCSLQLWMNTCIATGISMAPSLRVTEIFRMSTLA
jgi:hypothetical protein